MESSRPQHARWREAITLEYIKMEQMKVWIKVKRSTMPRGRQCVRCKWVFDIKRNGVSISSGSMWLFLYPWCGFY
jgi:hypothetical protein